MEMTHSAKAFDPVAAGRWSALLTRCSDDAEAAFFYGVTTTLVFCRPGCRSRLPKRENVRFFNTVDEAFAAGFHACKRCQPDKPPRDEEVAAKITQACRLLEQADAPGLEALARLVGMSQFHFHRSFKARVGVTPKQYQAAHKINRFKNKLRRSGSVTEALYTAGFGSVSRAYDGISKKLGMSPGQYKKGGEGVEIWFTIEDSPLRLVLLAATERGVCAVEIGSNAKVLQQELVSDFPKATLTENGVALKNHLAELRKYLSAPSRGLVLPLDIAGTAFQHRVWGALRNIPIGQTATYQQIARRIGAAKAVRAVGSACGANKVALAIPCHRAVRTDGSLGGYRWGVKRKRALLEAERAGIR